MKRDVSWIDIDKLVIDETNVRAEQWDADEEFINDVKTNEIMNPLLVRPLDGGKFGVICGSRRFNASIDAGIPKVPCVIEEMDDITALGRSIAENKYVRGVETWMYALKIGQMFSLADRRLGKIGSQSLTDEKKIELISNETGLGRTTVQDYLSISTLPPEILELMKTPEHRSKQIVERLKGMGMDIQRPLEFKKAVMLARQCKGMNLDRLFATAVHMISLERQDMEDFIDKVKSYPLKRPDEIYKEMKQVIERMMRLFVMIDKSLQGILETEATKNSIDIKELINILVREALKSRGYHI